MKKGNKGITLIALVITIIILLILAGVTIASLSSENGILGKAEGATEENRKQTATEIINLKITNTQLQSYKEEEKMPDLQYLADWLYEDNEIQYIYNESQKNANIGKEKITVTGKTIFTKLNDYPYEFEIDSFLRLASINGVKVAETDEDSVTISKTEYEELKGYEEENELLKRNREKLLGVFTWWKQGASWNEAGLHVSVQYNNDMCTYASNKVTIKEPRKIFNFHVFLQYQ